MSAVLALLFGCSQSAFWCLTSPIVVDMLGLDQLATAFGVLTFTRGVACLLGPPLGGFIIDITGIHVHSYFHFYTFYVKRGNSLAAITKFFMHF